MKVWACNFNGHYLGGTAVVVAPDEATARDLLWAELGRRNLQHRNQRAELTVTRVDTRAPQVVTLHDGDY